MAINNNNPSDKYGPIASQNRVIAVVIDDKDPKETGRFKCRILGEQDDTGRIPDDKLPWYGCMTNGQAQMRGFGTFPPQYTVGSRVVLESDGQQGFHVVGSVPNTVTDKPTEDRHTEGTKTTPEKQFKKPGEPSWYTLFDGSKHVQDLERTTDVALRILNQTITSQRQNIDNKKKEIAGDPTKPVNFDQGPAKYLSDTLNPQTIGTLKQALGSLTNPQQYVNQTLGSKLGVMVPNSTSILENLKQTAKNKLNIPAIDSIGGMSNYMGAIQGILSFVKNKAKTNNQTDEIINELYALYKQETGKNALDANGNETEDYKVWEQQYYMRGIS